MPLAPSTANVRPSAETPTKSTTAPVRNCAGMRRTTSPVAVRQPTESEGITTFATSTFGRPAQVHALWFGVRRARLCRGGRDAPEVVAGRETFDDVLPALDGLVEDYVLKLSVARDLKSVSIDARLSLPADENRGQA